MFNSYVSLPEGKCDEHVIETESAPDIPKVDMSRSGRHTLIVFKEPS